MDKSVNDFVIFVLEMYKFKYNMSGLDVYNLFQKYGVFKYLEDGYDVLHTQGHEWLIEDIDEYLRIRGYNK